jgi:3'(2'), 5'-bisphosphate nucleotidase
VTTLEGDGLTDSELSRELAREAGRLLLEVRRTYGVAAQLDRAANRELRDAADREAHVLIERRLAQHRPGDALLSEEGDGGLARLEAERVWIVDPLDGTWEYGQGRDDFAVHIALWTREAQGAVLSAATVDLPSQDITWSVLDPAPTSYDVPRDRPVRVVVSRSRRPEGLDELVARLADRLAAQGVTDRGVEVVQVGSVGAKAAEVYAGRVELYLHDSGFHDWDLAAPLGVALHRGLSCTAPDGGGFTFNAESTLQPGVIMCVPWLAEHVSAVLDV